MQMAAVESLACVILGKKYWFSKFLLQIRFNTSDFACPVYIHCHILKHEDSGMMMVVDIVKKGLLLCIPESTVSANQF